MRQSPTTVTEMTHESGRLIVSRNPYSERPDADFDRNRRVAAPGQWRRPHPGSDRASRQISGRRSIFPHGGRISDRQTAELSGNSDCAAARSPIPPNWTWAWMRWFHNAGRGTMVSTASLASELRSHGFNNVLRWPRGVDSALFHPDRARDLGLKHPIFLTVGRLAVEKNLDAFLALDLPGTKVVIGDGPARAELQSRYRDAVFLGTKHGAELAAIYASADVFVFPSRTDTFGLVLLEALASGLPIAGFPVAATQDVVGAVPVAVLDNDL